MQAEGEETHVPDSGEKQVPALCPAGRGAEAPAVYLQATQRTPHEGEEKDDSEPVSRPSRSPHEQADEQVQSEHHLEQGQRVGRERDEPLGER